MSFNTRYTQNIKTGSKTSAKGLEGVIIKFGFAIVDITTYVNTIFYGKPKTEQDSTNKRKKNPLDIGVIPLLDEIISVDFCELLSYISNKLANADFLESSFNPLEEPSDSFGKIKWKFQKVAYDVQLEIDAFYNEYSQINTEDSKIGALNLLTKIRNYFSDFTTAFSPQPSTTDSSPIDPDILLLLDAFPQLKKVGNYVNDTLSFFTKFTDSRQLQSKDIDKIVNVVQKIRQYCVLIQSLNSPTAVLSAIRIPALNQRLDSLLDSIDIQNIVPTLKRINQTIKKIISICNNINNIINFCRVMIRTFSTIIFVFKVIISVLKKLPVPNSLTTVGVTNTASAALKEIQDKGPSKFETRLFQISTLLSSITLLINSLLPILNEIIQKINILIANIESCKDAPTDILDDMKQTNNQLQLATDSLQAFINNKKENDLTRSSNTQLGEYTIQIIEEQVVEETFSLRRRYGVALNNQGILAVRSQPTFASDDTVIINEVKLLLQQSGLIKDTDQLYSDSELSLLQDVNAYLADDNVNYTIDSTAFSQLGQDDASVLESIRGLKDNAGLRKKARSALSRNMRNLRNTLNRGR